MSDYHEDSSETRELLQRVQAGDRSAFDRLFDRHRGELKRMVELRLDARLRQRMDASDVVQEAHLDAFRRLQDYLRKRPMPFRIWLRKNTQERLAKMRRDNIDAAIRSVDREQQLPDNSSLLIARQILGREPSPSENVRQDEFRQKVAAAVSDLADVDREVLLMRHAEGLSHREIGYLLEVDVAATRKRYARALLRLKGRLVAHGVVEDDNESAQ
jgi:RNA polymerase sigma-70 factor (ECF subfamily)